MNEDYVELFNTNKDFRNYVERYIFKHHVTIEEALSRMLVHEYAHYLMTGEHVNGKHTETLNCGC